MTSPDSTSDIARLENNLARSRATRSRSVGIAMATVGAGFATAVFVDGTIGAALIASGVALLLVAVYITGLRIIEWKKELYLLENPPPDDARR